MSEISFRRFVVALACPLALAFGHIVAYASADEVPNRLTLGSLEQISCGPGWPFAWLLGEPAAFAIWREYAGIPRGVDRSSRTIEVVRDVFTQDGRRLGGYKVVRSNARGLPSGYLLVAGGNATLAEQLVGDFDFFVAHGIDVYVFDYRGHGISEGIPRISALIDDYGVIQKWLASK
jgi:pimeloyl-ACP methyl ester carboxylesterase